MRKLIAGFASSVDGYIEGTQGEYGWILIDKEIDFQKKMQRFDAFLFGRKSYEAVLAFGNNPFPGITNYVISNTLKNAKNFIVISGDVEKQVGDLKKQPGKDIAVWGGANLLASLLDLQLVDELTIAFIPVLLGKGKTMVDILKNNVWLSFNTSKVYENGTVELTYKVVYKAYNQSI